MHTHLLQPAHRVNWCFLSASCTASWGGGQTWSVLEMCTCCSSRHTDLGYERSFATTSPYLGKFVSPQFILYCRMGEANLVSTSALHFLPHRAGTLVWVMHTDLLKRSMSGELVSSQSSCAAGCEGARLFSTWAVNSLPHQAGTQICNMNPHLLQNVSLQSILYCRVVVDQACSAIDLYTCCLISQAQ